MGASTGKPAANPGRITAAINDCANTDGLPIQLVIDCERKSFRKQAVIVLVRLEVNSGIKPKRFNVGVKAGQKVRTQAGFLLFVDVKSFDEVEFGLIKDPDVHDTARRMRSLATAQS